MTFKEKERWIKRIDGLIPYSEDHDSLCRALEGVLLRGEEPDKETLLMTVPDDKLVFADIVMK